MVTDKKIDLIIYLSTDWNSYSANTRGYFGDALFIRALSKLAGVKVLCVNLPFTPVETMLKKKAKAIKWIKGERLEQLEDNLFLYTPFAFIHDMLAVYAPAFQKLNRTVLSIQIKKQLKNLGFDSSIRASWIYHPLHYTYFGLVDENFKIYKCWDLYKARDYPLKVRHAISIYERRLTANSDIIFTPCINLYKELLPLNRNTFFIPAGVDIQESKPAIKGMMSTPGELIGFKKPIIGFAGIITKRVDMFLIRFLAESRPDWSIVILGSISEEPQLLKDNDYCAVQKMPNIHFLGFKEFEILPSYFNCFDVCILPHSNIEAMRYSHPYKILQYLASGKPVVSTDFPDAYYYKDVIKIARDHREFVDMTEKALSDTSEDSKRSRINFAKNNTWVKRAQETHRILQNLFALNE